MNTVEIKRISNTYLFADIIKIGKIFIRVGTFPGISKYLNLHKLDPHYIVVLPPVTSVAGDNFTGETFVLYNKLAKNESDPNYYIGYKNYIKYLHERCRISINQTFNSCKTKIITRNRLRKIFKPVPVKVNSFYHLNDQIKILINLSNIRIYYRDKLVYDWFESCPSLNISQAIKNMLQPYKGSKQKYLDDSLVIIPLGTGNGFYGDTSNFIIQFADRSIWIDPMVQPFLALKKIKLHWNKITDYLITHIHEDHIEGFSAILKYALLNNYKINLITTQKIFNALQRLYSFLFPDFIYLVNHINVLPDTTLPYHHAYLSIRHNHHTSQSGTLGLKIKYKNNCFALSGDTLYSEELAIRYPDHYAFDPGWYRECDLVFHEAEFYNKNTSHTYYKELQKLQLKIKAPVLCYHNSQAKFLLPAVKQNKKYIIRNNKVSIK